MSMSLPEYTPECHINASIFFMLSLMRIPVKGKQGVKAERDSEVELAPNDSGRMEGQGFKATSAVIDFSCSRWETKGKHKLCSDIKVGKLVQNHELYKIYISTRKQGLDETGRRGLT